MAWRVARSLDALLGQLNAMAPGRSKVSDGSIGDTSHQNRSSDHNPWYGPGIVTARDFTHDPAGGLDCNWLADKLVRSGDARIKYIIWDRRIWQAGRWTGYSGINPHTHHLHLSVQANPSCDDTRAWNLGAPTPSREAPDVNADEHAWLGNMNAQITGKHKSKVNPEWECTPVEFLQFADLHLTEIKATLAAQSAAIAALSNDQDLTRDEVAAIIRDAVQQSIQITGDVRITSKESPQ
ncbi:hypothetical protein JOF56_011614 [Kibdelosporangium banguiense]|uniref:Uncharacterized protein n=1 Tax=Kibdelosporangium banguiense TaxID=1365924 RepID=A0ABS4U3I4_9PSEU|nr:hypothetical protein [Kibdelosporangium banguiense]MBP2331229.1 hypothetical protein [Kibdelosporangium banguiense]